MNNAELRQAVAVLKKGGVIAYPTETVYGLGCDPRKSSAIRRIYSLKGRDRKKQLLLVAASIAQVRKVAKLEGAALVLARKYWPGPLTLVLPSLKKGSVAIRVSSSSIVQDLCRAFGYPIISTSANRSGETECRSGRAVKRLFAQGHLAPDFVIDAGGLPRRKTSTVAHVRKDGTVEIVRVGAIKL